MIINLQKKEYPQNILLRFFVTIAAHWKKLRIKLVK